MHLKKKLIIPTILLCLVLLSLLKLYSSYQNDTSHDIGKDDTLRKLLSRTFPYDPAASLPKQIWQTWKTSPSDDEFPADFLDTVESWTTMNPEYSHQVITDASASLLISQLYADVGKVQQAFEALPEAVLKADFFRYLVLLAQGGIYSDIDTKALKPINDWIAADLQPYGMVVGIEADPDRPDWHDWYARRIQFCQWTIASKPGHPVLVDVVASITEETLERQAVDELRSEAMKGVMEFTGPGIWTDLLFKYFNDFRNSMSGILEDRNVTWESFTGLKEPTKEGDIVVLPITSFSPGVGHMGSKSTSDPLAFVSHRFSGTWKEEEQA